jgi:polyisoprenoid-binding protein YceI
VWNLDASDGELIVRTGVEGRAARMGHRLTIAINAWHATVTWTGGEPASVELIVEVNSLEVRKGEGGITPLSAPEKTVVRSNALNTLGARRFPRIRFGSSDIGKTRDGYRLAGTLEIHGTTRTLVVDVRVDDPGRSWAMACETGVRQSDYGIKPYSLLMGAVKVADHVTVSWRASRRKDDD